MQNKTIKLELKKEDNPLIILYIPFNEENDLVAMAVSWKNTTEDKDTIIIQHGDEINYHAFEHHHLKIYILAHGVDDLLHYSFYVASTALSTSKTAYLDIEKIVDRFNSDFTGVKDQVKNIKLYFCNNKGNQKSIAEIFNNNLILFNSPIDYYAGSIYSPFTDKKKYAQYSGKWYRCSKVRHTIYRPREDLDEDYGPESLIGINLKEKTMIEFLENAKQKRHDSAFKRQYKARQKLFWEYREKYIENKEIVDEFHPSHILYL